MRALISKAGPRRGSRRWLGFAIPAASNIFRASTMAGLAELETPAGAMIEDLLWWTAALKAARGRSSRGQLSA
jgi:hypothetical protein